MPPPTTCAHAQTHTHPGGGGGCAGGAQVQSKKESVPKCHDPKDRVMYYMYFFWWLYLLL